MSDIGHRKYRLRETRKVLGKDVAGAGEVHADQHRDTVGKFDKQPDVSAPKAGDGKAEA
jgi:hypothetical protein